MSGFLSGLLASIIRPIIQEQIEALKGWILDVVQTNVARKDSYDKHDKEAEEIIAAAEKATTTEEVKAHVRRLKDIRAKLHH
jgi:phosphopantothenoylcysteine synthetase/decarboxylase